MVNVIANQSAHSVTISINGIPHINIPKAFYRSFESWKWEDEGRFEIYVYLAGSRPMHLVYEDAAIWIAVLTELSSSLTGPWGLDER